MGYTHTFRIQPGSPEYADAWPHLVSDTARIISAVTESHGIVITGPSAAAPPRIDVAKGICFNGDIANNLHLDTLTINPPGRVHSQTPDDCAVWRFVKTEQLPYDLAVTAALLRMRQLMPNACAIGSNGTWHQDWAPARTLNWRIFGTDRAELAQDLLVDTTEGMAITLQGWVDPRLASTQILPQP
ncbi:hypothetical protein [Catellatospora chokoriensis]|uniref:Uncharacterized protein n=2 Tax=Catellatospora chokoriensis TaxID=310353 RepID=A0A8J3K7X2_9ACTN|nr:hypothetical protein [Catellatospora chokoriensis]GIF94846.1 hypothetical protein Cch02nite_82900 [Catellatospora chokoriensis]